MMSKLRSKKTAWKSTFALLQAALIGLATSSFPLCTKVATAEGFGGSPVSESRSDPEGPSALTLVRIQFELPKAAGIQLSGADARRQLQVAAVEKDGQLFDVTRDAEIIVEPSSMATVDANGMVSPKANGIGKVVAKLGDHLAEVVLEVTGLESIESVSFSNQVVPIFTKYGCNGGGCHGKAAGQNGFKLSLLGFEPGEDYEHLVNESRGRRVFPAAPEQSLLLQKAINASPHGGGQRLTKDSQEYRLLVRWIAQGMPKGSADDPVVQRIEVSPATRTLVRESSQQLAALAYYSDGRVEDITQTVQYESNNTDIAEVDPQGLVSLKAQAGDVAVMARYQGQVAVFRASVPLGAEISYWPETRNVVDQHVFANLKTLGIPPSQLCDDATFLRRVTLDLAGRLPTLEETKAYSNETDPAKADELVDRLLGSSDYAEFFAKKWSTILRNRRDGVGEQFGTFAFYDWLREGFYSNKPYDQMVRDLLTASGSVDVNPAVAWYREVPSTESRVEDAAQLFLGQRIQCARCHHHPYEKWSQADYFHMSAFFSKVARKECDAPEEPRFINRMGGAGASHPKTGKYLPPAGLDSLPLQLDSDADPRSELADWMVAGDNPFFARALVNRYWKHFFSRGLVEPEDDMRATNPPSNPALLDGMADYFIQSDFDLKSLVRLICTSNSYRLSSLANTDNLGDKTSYSRFYPKRLQAEMLIDSVDQVVGTSTPFAGMPLGTRSVSLPDTSFDSYFLTVFGQPDSTTACECERSQEANLAQSLHLLNSKDIQSKLSNDQARPMMLAAAPDVDLEASIGELYLRALSRQPSQEELQVAIVYMDKKQEESATRIAAQSMTDEQQLKERQITSRQAYEDLIWALINSKEFLFNH